MSLARDDELFQDGVRVIVNWDAMQVGHSVFVPCLNSHRLIRDVRKIFARKGWHPRFTVCVENHILGVRIWRAA
jgi:hypothetical protein